MTRTWITVVTAAFFEVGWVIGLKASDSFTDWAATVFAVAVSFRLLIKATKKLPVGTVYAVFVGLGTAGTTIAEIILFGAEIQPAKIGLIALLLAGVIALKLESASAKGA
ncbi:DMT family transporter [Seleniivibrio woodruffii]|uniref:DMT family transporter n=1 Tax=Seleniivibrio woodruffii TaxID=1078050 RepID=UPI0039E3381C